MNSSSMFWLIHKTTELNVRCKISGCISILRWVDNQPPNGLYIPAAHEGVADKILNAHAQGRHADPRNNKLEDKDGDTSGHAAGKGCESQEQDHTRLPCDTRSTIAERVGAEALFFDRVDDEHAQAGEDERQPVDELHVDIGAVLGRLGPDGGVEHDIEGEGELRMHTSAISSSGSRGLVDKGPGKFLSRNKRY